MRSHKGLIAAVLTFGCLGAGSVRAEDIAMPVAVLQALDKITARVQTIEAPVGETIRFSTLQIIARACYRRPAEEAPESTAFLDIWDMKREQTPLAVFRGWVFASSPALSAVEHPVYDVWLLDCRAGSKGR
ncbi:MAG: DUF2155 domain-containing protein [Alphaproteobacteria bacterium]|nr:DUF2155 domain-containing protein [Alphaproteobacteria bacterium]